MLTRGKAESRQRQNSCLTVLGDLRAAVICWVRENLRHPKTVACYCKRLYGRSYTCGNGDLHGVATGLSSLNQNWFGKAPKTALTVGGPKGEQQMSTVDLPLQTLLGYLQKLAEQSLSLWDVPEDAVVRLINISENTTYLVEASQGYKAILRIHRKNYHSLRAIESELAWLEALGREKVIRTPDYYLGRNSCAIQFGKTDALIDGRFMVLFHFVDGNAPDESLDMTYGFHALGAIAARCHDHAISWAKPTYFERLTWDAEAVFGPAATWGNWRDAPLVDRDIAKVLEEVEKTVCARLEAFGKASERFNLIHADMRLANLLVGQEGTRLIDFDDCGHGWFLYDFAASISFIEDDPRIPAFKDAWVRGYRSIRDLNAEDEAEIETFIMLRRMALLAWIGSHIEAPEAQKLAPEFASVTAKIGKLYLEQCKMLTGN